VRLSYRGTGASEGVSDNWGPQTRKDVLEVGKWIVAQPWADGLVPAGTSAEGAWITYALDIPEVKATLWETSCADPLRGCIRNGGTLAGGIGALTEGVVAGYAAGMQQRIQNGYASNPDPASQWAEQVPYIAPAYTEDTNTPYWQERLGLQYLAAVHAPVMFTTDLYDFVPEGMYVAYEHTAPKYRWLDLGYGHASSRQEFTDGTPLNGLVFGPVRRFLEHFVFGADNDFENEPRVTVVTNLGTPSGYERGEVLVRGERRWPLPTTRFTRLHLGEKALTSSAATTEASDTAPIVSVGPFGELRTTLVASGGFPQDQQNTLVTNYMDDLSPREAAGLTYTTQPLADDVELTGPVVAHPLRIDDRARFRLAGPPHRRAPRRPQLVDLRRPAARQPARDRPGPLTSRQARRHHPPLVHVRRPRDHPAQRGPRVLRRARPDLEHLPRRRPHPLRHSARCRRLRGLGAHRRRGGSCRSLAAAPTTRACFCR